MERRRTVISLEFIPLWKGVHGVSQLGSIRRSGIKAPVNDLFEEVIINLV